MRRTKGEALGRRLMSLATQKVEAPPPEPAKPKDVERGAARKTTFRFGRIISDDGAVTICILRDLSPKGARIAFEGESALSPVVTLKIDQTAETKKARVAWQRGNEAGLDFE